MKQQVLFATIALSIGTANCQAAEYFGLDLGVGTKASVLEVLNKAGATVDTNLGYKGYEDLTYYRIIAYDRMLKYGAIKEAQLEFSPTGLLSRISVTYVDDYQKPVYTLLRDGLGAKYAQMPSRGFGFGEEAQTYRAENTEIKLEHDRMDDETTVSFEWLPTRPTVESMKRQIERAIREKNAKKILKDI